jgi:polyferredoxin
MLRRFRIAFAIFFWLGITVLFLDVSGLLHAYLSWMASLQFLPAVLAGNVGIVVLFVVITLLAGRIYCSVICPLGVMQDIISRIASWLNPDKKKRKFGRFGYLAAKWPTFLRYTVLAVFLVALFLGSGTVVQIFAPYSSYGRIMTTIFRPGVDYVNNLLADWAVANDSYAFSHVELWMRSGAVLAVAVSSLAVIGIMALCGGRLYCNSVCPVGTVLGLLARRSIFRVHISPDKCTKCGLCERKCKAMAINAKEHFVDTTRCVDCFDCLDACHTGALKYGMVKNAAAPVKTEAKSANEGKTDASRRAFLTTAVSVAAIARLQADTKIVDGGLAAIEDKKPYQRQTPVCPPGAVSLRNLQQKCTGCLLCVSACPNNVLRPSTGLLHFMQPTLSYEYNHCRPECHACSDVCPAGAILPLGTTHEEKMARKSSLKIGRAVWIADNCVPLTDGVNCGNCAVHCPAGAIKMVPSNPDDRKSVRIPVVDEERCIGCGACEHLCPSRPYSAIHVEGIEVQREI